MKIAGLVKSSLIDYPGKVAAVVFTQGCNFRCGFCHNPDLIAISNQQLAISEEDVLNFLKTRTGKLDGVVITGGEPLIQKDIEDFIRKIKALGFAVKLDTNGSNPRKLSQLINSSQIDYIAMDIKGSLAKYGEICGYLNTKVIQDSIGIIMDSNIDYEFRTTVLPKFHELNDFIEIGKMINKAKQYAIQGFRSQITLDKNLRSAKSFNATELTNIAQIIKPYVQKVVIHDNL